MEQQGAGTRQNGPLVQGVGKEVISPLSLVLGRGGRKGTYCAALTMQAVIGGGNSQGWQTPAVVPQGQRGCRGE